MSPTDERIRLVLIDDDPAHRRAVRQAIARESVATTVATTIEEFDSAASGLAWLTEPSTEPSTEQAASPVADCILLDDSLPDADVVDVLERLRTAQSSIPVILLTSLPSIESDPLRTATALRRGAFGLLSKTNLDPLALGAMVHAARQLRAANQRARAAEAELRESVDQLERAIGARDSVLSVVSHDLRGPLNNIELAMGLLEEHVSDQQRALAIASVHRAITRADRLISDLLDVARLSGGAIDLVRESVDPTQVVETAISDVRPSLEQHKLKLHVDVANDVEPIFADRNRVIQVLDNLLRNAIKYGRRGGEVRVEVRPARLSGRPGVEFSVIDQGPGLDAEACTHVFDRFWRAHDRKTAVGSGLGLAIAHGLVSSHGGEIGVDSTPGAGARFYFSIPLAKHRPDPRAS